ncbi:hypothetical protein [Spirillospora sp. CA-294931]|uniref:hypothetical protein n=1 Tax=Spirillospora sp. CA-294931 TaxID=3240042 RepID=UPI003D8B1E99
MPDLSAPSADSAVRLLRFLRDLARARQEPGRDAGARGEVHWLAELPGDVYVETDAGPGDVLFSVPVIPLTPPAVMEEFDGWLGMRQWYRTLRDLTGSDGGEVVLATGLLSWKPESGPAVREHLLATPVRVAADERTGRVDVLLAGHTTLRDRELLAGLPGFRPSRTDWVWDAVHAGQALGLRASVSDVLRKWCSVAFASDDPREPGETVVYREDWAPGPSASSVPRLRLAPALVARPARQAGLVDFYEELLARLSTPGAPFPAGLARLLEPEERSRLLHVEDPEPDTLPDLLTGLLSRGRRALVVTSGPAAAERLRSRLAPGVAELCTTDGSVTWDAPHEPADVEELADREAAWELEVAALRERLRLAEDTGPYELAPGYHGARADLERRLRIEAADHGWIPPRPGLGRRPPLTASEAAELAGLLAGASPSRRARPGQRDVDPGALPSPAYVRTLFDAEAAAVERAERSQSELSRRLRGADVAVLARLEGCAATVNAALHDLGLSVHPSGWDPADHAVRAFADALAQRRPTVWARVGEMTAQAEWAERALAASEGRRVELPPHLHLRKVAAAAQELRNYLAEGGTLKRGPLRSAPQRQADPLLAGCTIDGEPPNTPERLEILFNNLMVRMACQELQYVWEAAGVSFPAEVPLEDRVARFGRAHARLARVQEVLPALAETADLIHRSGLGIPITHPLQWHGYVVGLENAMLGMGVNRTGADITALRDSIGPGAPDDPPELRAALAAIDARDAAAYGRCLGGLAEARHERALQIRCDALLDRVHAAHPDLAAAFPTGHVEHWDEAWAWAYASARLAELPLSPAEKRLRAELADAEAGRREASGTLAAALAWEAHGPLGPDSPAPCWILPLRQIPTTLPPEPDSFDAVIVDGEHDAGAEALFLLWLAPRIILVGQGADTLPGAPLHVPDEALPEDLRATITPTAPLFQILQARFTATGPPPTPVPAPRPDPDPVPDPEPVVREEHAPDVRAARPMRETRGGLAFRLDPELERRPEAPRRRSPEPPSEPRPGRSIVTYKRPELIELVAAIAEREPEATDERLIELARTALGCPEDEELLVGARLRYAVEAFREE